MLFSVWVFLIVVLSYFASTIGFTFITLAFLFLFLWLCPLWCLSIVGILVFVLWPSIVVYKIVLCIILLSLCLLVFPSFVMVSGSLWFSILHKFCDLVSPSDISSCYFGLFSFIIFHFLLAFLVVFDYTAFPPLSCLFLTASDNSFFHSHLFFSCLFMASFFFFFLVYL